MSDTPRNQLQAIFIGDQELLPGGNSSVVAMKLAICYEAHE